MPCMCSTQRLVSELGGGTPQNLPGMPEKEYGGRGYGGKWVGWGGNRDILSSWLHRYLEHSNFPKEIWYTYKECVLNPSFLGVGVA